MLNNLKLEILETFFYIENNLNYSTHLIQILSPSPSRIRDKSLRVGVRFQASKYIIPNAVFSSFQSPITTSCILFTKSFVKGRSNLT